MKNFSIIAAMDKNRGIGKKQNLPWHIKSELQHFAKTTRVTQNPKKQNAVIMGRNSWYSLPQKFRPLPSRLNIVLTKDPDEIFGAGVLRALSLNEALESAEANNVEKIFVIGGATVFSEALSHPNCNELLITEILGDFDCDMFFPEIDPSIFKKIIASDTLEDQNIEFRFVMYERKSNA